MAIKASATTGLMHEDASKVLERKFSKMQTVVKSHLDKIIYARVQNVKMGNPEVLINLACVNGSVVAGFKSLAYEADLKSSSLWNHAVSKLPPSFK